MTEGGEIILLNNGSGETTTKSLIGGLVVARAVVAAGVQNVSPESGDVKMHGDKVNVTAPRPRPMDLGAQRVGEKTKVNSGGIANAKLRRPIQRSLAA